MKIQKHIFLFSIVLFGIFLSDCKKYEEDDVFIQWKRPEKRLFKYGPWVFEKLTVDGVDKSAEFRADSAYFDRIEFWDKPGGDSRNFTIYETNGYSYAYGFYDDNNKLLLSVYSIWITELNKYGPIFNFNLTEWTIKKWLKKA